MSLLRTLRKLIFGETWFLPAGVAAAVAAALVVRHLAGDEWRDIGGFVLLAGVIVALTLSVRRG
jgi:hypothetical protein